MLNIEQLESFPRGLEDSEATAATRALNPLFQLLRGVHPSTVEVIGRRYNSMKIFLQNKSDNLKQVAVDLNLHQEKNVESMTPIRAFYVFKKGFVAKTFNPHFAICVESSCVGERFTKAYAHLQLDVGQRLVVDEQAFIDSFLNSTQLLEKVHTLPLNLLIEAENLGKQQRSEKSLKVATSMRIERHMHSVLRELEEESYQFELSALLFKESGSYVTAVQFKGQWFFCRKRRVSILRAQQEREKSFRYFYLRKNHDCMALYRLIS